MILDLSASASKTSGVGVEITLGNFSQEVLKASHDKIIILDFWASWCGPCRQLMPVLEKIVHESQGKLMLAKVDIDKNQDLLLQLRAYGIMVQSVPTVFFFYKGKIIHTFTGAMGEKQLTDLMASLYKTLGIKDESQFQKMLLEAKRLYDNEEYSRSYAEYSRLISHDTVSLDALAGMAQCCFLLHKGLEAQSIIEKIPENYKGEMVNSVRSHMKLLEDIRGDVFKIKNDSQKDLAIVYKNALKKIVEANFQEAIENLMTIIKKDRSCLREMSKKVLLCCFDVLGSHHKLTVSGRKALSSVLFS